MNVINQYLSNKSLANFSKIVNEQIQVRHKIAVLEAELKLYRGDILKERELDSTYSPNSDDLNNICNLIDKLTNAIEYNHQLKSIIQQHGDTLSIEEYQQLVTIPHNNDSFRIQTKLLNDIAAKKKPEINNEITAILAYLLHVRIIFQINVSMFKYLPKAEKKIVTFRNSTSAMYKAPNEHKKFINELRDQLKNYADKYCLPDEVTFFLFTLTQQQFQLMLLKLKSGQPQPIKVVAMGKSYQDRLTQDGQYQVIHEMKHNSFRMITGKTAQPEFDPQTRQLKALTLTEGDESVRFTKARPVRLASHSNAPSPTTSTSAQPTHQFGK